MTALPSAATSATSNRRAFWLRQLRQWHWISAAISLLGTLMFAITGITLNHASEIEARPEVTRREAVVPSLLVDRLRSADRSEGTLPPELVTWLKRELRISPERGLTEWSRDELYLSLPRPGGDAWLSIDLQNGIASYEETDRGWISYLNDLHKGRNTGPLWSLFIDGFAIACILFCLTGLALLQLYASHRRMTWPLVGLGCAIPILITALLIH